MSALTLTSLAEDYAVYIHYLNWFKHPLSANSQSKVHPTVTNHVQLCKKHDYTQYKLHCPTGTSVNSIPFFPCESHWYLRHHLSISTAARKSDILDVINLITRKTHCTKEGKMFPVWLHHTSCYVWLSPSWDHFQLATFFTTLPCPSPLFSASEVVRGCSVGSTASNNTGWMDDEWHNQFKHLGFHLQAISPSSLKKKGVSEVFRQSPFPWNCLSRGKSRTA